MEEMRKKLEEVLQMELKADTPEELVKQLATIEAFTYLPVKYQTLAEKALSTIESELRKARLDALQKAMGTVQEKQASVDAATDELLLKCARYEREVNYWKGVGKLFEKKIMLGQTILSTLSAQIKAGIYR